MKSSKMSSMAWWSSILGKMSATETNFVILLSSRFFSNLFINNLAKRSTNCDQILINSPYDRAYNQILSEYLAYKIQLIILIEIWTCQTYIRFYLDDYTQVSQ